MGDKNSGSKCYLKDTFPEIDEILSNKTDSEHEVKSKMMNRKNIKEDNGCMRTFELCQVLQDPECPAAVTIVKETFSKEIRNSSTAPEESEGKSNRVIYCREVIKPYINADNNSACDDELICDAMDAAAADFPTFNFCGQAQEKSEPDVPIPVDDKHSKKPSNDSLGQKPCYKKVKVKPDSVIAVSENNKLCLADKTKVCKEEDISVEKEKKSEKGKTKCKKLHSKKEITKESKSNENEAVDQCLETHSKTVETLKNAAQDMLCKAYTTVKSICSKTNDNSTNTRIPNNCPSEDTKPKKCSYENTSNNKNITDNDQNILNKAMTLTKTAVNTMSSFHNIMIREDLELCVKEKQRNASNENTTDQLNDTDKTNFNNHIDLIDNNKMRKGADCYDPCYNETAMESLSQKIESISLEESTESQHKKKKSVCGNSLNNKVGPLNNTSNNLPSNKSSETSVKVTNLTKFDPNKLKFADEDIVEHDTVENCKERENQIVSEKEDTTGDIKTKEKVVCPLLCEKTSVDSMSKKSNDPCETVEPFINTIADSASKITDSAYKTSANVVDVLSEQKSYFVEKIKEHIDFIGTTLVEKKDSVSGRIEELKGRILGMTQQDKKKDPYIDSYKDTNNCTQSKTESLMNSINTTKQSAKVIAMTGAQLFDKVCSSTTSLVTNVAVKTVSLVKPDEEPNTCDEEEIKPTEGLTKQFISTMSSTATRISKTLEQYHEESSPYDVPEPNPRDISMSFEEDDECVDDLNIGVFDSLKSKLYSMFYDTNFSVSSRDPCLSTTSTSSRMEPESRFLDKKP